MKSSHDEALLSMPRCIFHRFLLNHSIMPRSPSPPSTKRYSSRQRERDYRDLDNPRSRSRSPGSSRRRRRDDSFDRYESRGRRRDDSRDRYRRSRSSRSPPSRRDRRSPDRRGKWSVCLVAWCQQHSSALTCQIVVDLETEAEAALNHPHTAVLALEMACLPAKDQSQRNPQQKTRSSTWIKMAKRKRKMMRQR